MPVIVLTGSLIASRVVNDSLTLLAWARGASSPLPLPHEKLTQRFWKLALDVPQRASPGALRRWCKAGEPTLAGVGRRYTETPGIVCSSGANVIGTSLTCTTELVRITATPVLEAFDHVRNGRAPNGGELLDPDGANTWILCQTLALGYYRVYDPEPPLDWLHAKRNWTAYCREHIQSTDCKCDTERQVKDHIRESGDGCWPLDEWQEIEHEYRLQQRTIWLDKSRLRAAKQWALRHKQGIIWTQHRAFGFALADYTGLPYYGSQARDKATGKYITDHKLGSPCIASIKVCSEDLDLQHTFFENLYVSPPATGAWHEQSLARTHRYGQPQPEVTGHYWIACAENRDAISVARARERGAAQMTGDKSRKLLIADWNETPLRKLVGPQWSSKKIAKELMR